MRSASASIDGVEVPMEAQANARVRGVKSARPVWAALAKGLETVGPPEGDAVRDGKDPLGAAGLKKRGRRG